MLIEILIDLIISWIEVVIFSDLIIVIKKWYKMYFYCNLVKKKKINSREFLICFNYIKKMVYGK